MFRPKRGGQGTVEFALILPVLITTILGIIEISWVMFQTIAVNHVCRQATRRGSIGLKNESPSYALDTFIANSLGVLHKPSTQKIYEVFDTSGNLQDSNSRASGMYLRITIVHRLQFFSPLMDTFNRVEANTTIQASTQFQIE